MLIKTQLINGVNKLVKIEEISYEEFLLDKYEADEKTIIACLKKDGLKPREIEAEISRMQKAFRIYCNEYDLKVKSI